jgi:ABC-type multidrug transport system fused ATPase/permease subunit
MNTRVKSIITSGGFTFLTLISIGVCTFVFGYIYSFLCDIGIKGASTNMHIYALLACIFSALLLVFSLIAPCFNKRGLKMATSIIYVIYDAIIIGAVCAMFFFKTRIVVTFQPVWPDNEDSNQTCIVKTTECCGWNQTNSSFCLKHNTEQYEDCRIGISENVTCQSALDSVVQKEIERFFILFIVIAVILSLGTVVAFIISCPTSSDSDDGEKARESMNTPLTYGW